MFSTAPVVTPENSYPNENVRPIFSDSSFHDVRIRIDSVNLTILQPSSGVQFYQDGIVFLSHTKEERKMINKHLSFGTLDAYYTIPGENVSPEHIVFSPSAVFPYPCEAITFSEDFTTMFYTRKTKSDGKEKIFEAKNIGNKDHVKWIFNPKPVNFCEPNYRYTHPALSKDGEFMVFASDMTGSFGGMDLFISYREDYGWSALINLGQTINSKGNELFPYLDSDNNLFFSSDGLPGFGGYDIFFSKCHGISWDTLVNLSGNVNSAKNDIAFTINRSDNKTAYFTTKGNSRKGDIQLYRLGFDMIYKKPDSHTLSDILFNNALFANDFPVIVNQYPVAFRYINDSIPDGVTVQIEEESITIPPIEDIFTDNNLPIPEEITGQMQEDSIIAYPTEDVLTENHISVLVVPATDQAITVLKPMDSDDSDAEGNNDNVIYKVQFLSSIKPLGNFQIKINGVIYDAEEYLYKNVYRYTICEFKSLEAARKLSHACRQAGYPESFVAAFKNDIRSLDMSLFIK